MKGSVTQNEKSGEARSVLDDLARQGAKRMLKEALEVEVQEFVARHEHVLDEEGRRQVVRNGFLPQREVLTGAGSLEVRQPRVRDKRGQEYPKAVTFTSSILPKYLRRSRNMNELFLS